LDRYNLELKVDCSVRGADHIVTQHTVDLLMNWGGPNDDGAWHHAHPAAMNYSP